ncbi:MAG: DUF4982 domain-containing protein [Bacteroidetes bacterium]|nr:DUF4982 domain-containing protein [Bacteroidota bacterium]
MQLRVVKLKKVSVALLLSGWTVCSAQFISALPRQHLLMDFGWKFAFGHRTSSERDFYHNTNYFSYLAKAGFGDGPAAKDFDDRSWRTLNLPHDWAVELPFDSTASYSHGYKPVGKKFPQWSIGWYRKTFVVPTTEFGKRFILKFDGVFRNATVWFNGFYLGEEQSGYYGFSFDVTEYIEYGSVNVVSVRVDATMEEGWFYEGAGIYRHVWLQVLNPLHVVDDAVFVRSSIANGNASVVVDVPVLNRQSVSQQCTVEYVIFEQDGRHASKKRIQQIRIPAFSEYLIKDSVFVQRPRLWSIETPYLYTFSVLLRVDGKTIDSILIPFGIRTIHFDPQNGFFLNGKHVLLKGTNNHQDHAGVGVALPDALLEFRIRRLKEMGCNAYRSAHNPATPELLDICDRLGMLVIDENRLMGATEKYREYLKRMVLRGRNHPSIILWSIGNEEWAIEGNDYGVRIASAMQHYVQLLDPTRPVTYANSGGWGKGISTVQQVMGYNYIFNGDIDKHHREFPYQPSLGTEESTSRGTRGVYKTHPQKGHLAQIDRENPDGLSIEKGFRFYAERRFLAGLFYWTGFDYRGECSPFGWPQVTSQYGILDLCGFPKDMYYYLKAQWTIDTVLHIFPHWNWSDGDTVAVWCYTNCDSIELVLNKQCVGVKRVPQYSHCEWLIPFRKGTLIAHGYKQGKKVITTTRHTTGKSVAIELIADKKNLAANNEDVCVITVQIVDEHGTVVPTAQEEITFSIQGPGRILGVGNGDPASHEPEKYLDEITHVCIENLRGINVSRKDHYEEVDPMYNHTQWQPMVDEQGNYALKPHQDYPYVVIRGTFTIPTITPKMSVVLWPQILCEEQVIYINGHRIASNLRRGERLNGYTVPLSILWKGENSYTVIGPPLIPRFLYDNLNTNPGLIQIIVPAQQWKRKTFNGYAQVLIQATEIPGSIVLIGTSPSLKSGTVRLQSVKAKVRPHVPTVQQ